jgi:hypothetical protein
MSRGRTLWEILTGSLTGPAEFKYYNPLHAKIGAGFTIDDIEWRERNFVVCEIREYKRRVAGKQFLFADYLLVDRPLNAPEIRLRLRINPVADPQAERGLTHHALLLRLEDDLAYNQELFNAVQAPTKTFQILEGGKVEAEFSRINDLTEPYRAEVTVIRDPDANQRVDPDEIETLQLKYWDYWREIPDAAGQPVKEYLFVEMDSKTGWFQLWRGQAIAPEKVAVT